MNPFANRILAARISSAERVRLGKELEKDLGVQLEYNIAHLPYKALAKKMADIG